MQVEPLVASSCRSLLPKHGAMLGVVVRPMMSVPSGRQGAERSATVGQKGRMRVPSVGTVSRTE
jgi:hypothetical protein